MVCLRDECLRLLSLGEVCEDEGALLRRQLLLPGLLQQLLPHDGEDRAQQRPPEDLRGLVARQAVAELRHVAVAEPPAGGRGERCGQRPGTNPFTPKASAVRLRCVRGSAADHGH